MGFTIEEKAFLLERYFRNGEKQENGDWTYFITPCVEEFQARYPNRMDIDYQQIYQCIKIIVPNFLSPFLCFSSFLFKTLVPSFFFLLSLLPYLARK
jgi:hypothetical protein